MPEEIKRESVTKIDIEKLALNKDFGRLTFKESLPFLRKTQALFKELDELNYQNNLSQEEISAIDIKKDQFIKQLTQLQQFDIGQADSQTVHDNLEQQFINFYNSTLKGLMTQLVYLRQEIALQSKDERNLQEEQKAATKARKQSEEILEQLKKELNSIRKETKEVAGASGERAAVTLGKHFESQAGEYSSKANNWLTQRSTFFKWLLIIIGVNFILYLFLFITNKLGVRPNIAPSEFFTPQYGVVKLALLALLSYAIGFAGKNYNINSNLEAVNKHRKNVAETLSDFLKTKPEANDRSQLVKSAAEAMFRNSPSGYGSKQESKDDGPIHEIVNNIISSKKE